MSTPSMIQRDTYEAADAARQHLQLLQKPKFPWKPFKPQVKPALNIAEEAPVSATGYERHSNQTIRLSKPPYSDDRTEDLYVWCVLYENQRGMTLFSIPYYSHRSLLPSDPSPFTTPDANVDRRHQPDVSLAQYPLPDGNFRWVSSTWMIDMRSDSGEVQHDGFEYNWLFRQHSWRAQVGKFNAGGFVRRRRWVRLMMRPAQKPSPLRKDNAVSESGSPVISWSSPPSVLALEDVDIRDDEVWQDEAVDANWSRCHLVMRRLGRDGLKIELWKKWLEQTASNRQLELIAQVLRLHGNTILHSFVYPESRAQFLTMLGPFGLLAEMNVGSTAGELDFWSYVGDDSPIS